MDEWVFGAIVRREAGDYVVAVRDLPEVVTSGDNEAEALALTQEAIEVAIGCRMDRAEPLPQPSPVQDGEHPVALSALSGVKASLYEAWRDAGISKTELARRIGQRETEIRRILSLEHRTKLDRLEEVARALGKRLRVGIVSAAAR